MIRLPFVPALIVAARLLWLAQPLHAADAPVESVKSERVRIVETDQIIR